MELKFKKLAKEAVIPTYAHAADAGMDLTATRFTQEVDKSGKVILVYHTDLAVEIPEGYFGMICMRSSVCKKSISMCNAVAVIDSGYTGELIIKFKITTDAIPTVYQPGEKIAQLIILPRPEIEIVETEELAESERGDNGFGSSDKKEDNDKQTETKADDRNT